MQRDHIMTVDEADRMVGLLCDRKFAVERELRANPDSSEASLTEYQTVSRLIDAFNEWAAREYPEWYDTDTVRDVAEGLGITAQAVQAELAAHDYDEDAAITSLVRRMMDG